MFQVKAIIFGLCFFHAVLLERKRFGPRGWNMNYPFAMGDLRDSAMVLFNYMEQQQGGSKVPWDDLKYIFGEIMYGGHIIDPRDRLVCNTYLNFYMQASETLGLFPRFVPRALVPLLPFLARVYTGAHESLLVVVFMLLLMSFIQYMV